MRTPSRLGLHYEEGLYGMSLDVFPRNGDRTAERMEQRGDEREAAGCDRAIYL